eukprot:g8964.t1
MLSGSTYMNELMLSTIDERSEVNMLWLFLCLDDTVGKKLFSITSPKIREFNESFIAELVAGEDELTKRTLTIIKNYMSYEWIFEMALNSVRRLKANIEAKTASPSKLSDDMQNAMMQSRSSNMKCNLLTEAIADKNSKKMPKSPRKKKDDGKLKVLQKGTEMVGAMAPQFQLESTNAKVTNLNATEYSYLEPSLEELEERTRIQISAGGKPLTPSKSKKLLKQVETAANMLESTTKQRKVRWTSDEDYKLRKLVKKYSHQWKMVAQGIGQRSAAACRMRWVGLCCPNKTKRDKRKFWTKEEDQIVSIMQEKLGNRWVEIEIGNR